MIFVVATVDEFVFTWPTVVFGKPCFVLAIGVDLVVALSNLVAVVAASS